ncbi:MAG: Crp/Fnr family transcriptional regulator [Acidobacteria bacterium]|nr:Crp/Fnr family transcriptional regulator [Acidobacteriota bacterium]
MFLRYVFVGTVYGGHNLRLRAIALALRGPPLQKATENRPYHMRAKLNTTRSVSRNAILDSLPSVESATIMADLKPVELARNIVLFEAGEPVDSIYFPINSTISFLGYTGEGGRVEVWSVGNEGLAGLSGLLGENKPFRGVVQLPGNALVGKAAKLRRQFRQCGRFRDSVLRYHNSLFVQVSYLGLCNSRHSVEQRFCRWLLMLCDRSNSSVLNFTQDYIAGMLGTRRATITEAAAALQNANLISYTPGTITIKSRRALVRAACSCYKRIRSVS